MVYYYYADQHNVLEHNVQEHTIMLFINRKEELRRLRAVARSRRGAFVTLYGRRRIGKTRLLTEWLSQCTSCLFAADQSAPTIQRAYFAKALEYSFKGISHATYPDWASLFERLDSEIRANDWSGVLAIDELPYLADTSPELPSILQNFVDGSIKRSKAILAISGSSQRMMHGIVLDGSAPLFGRSDELMCLGPMNPYHMKALFPDIPVVDLIRLYSIFGGIPKYWELAHAVGRADIETIIDELVLDRLGPLHQEPDRLLSQEKPSAMPLRPLLDSIGSGANRISEIAGRLGQPATSLSRPLSALIQMDLVHKELPYGENEKKSKKSIYKIADPFFRFWFRVVSSNRSFFISSIKKQRIALYRKFAPALYAASFENICRQYAPCCAQSIPRYRKVLFGPAGRFWAGNGPEWDIVSVSIECTHVLLGEVKWHEKAVTLKDLKAFKDKLLAKGLPPLKNIEKMKVIYALFVPEKPAATGKDTDIALFDIHDILKCAARE
ncbi:MAG: hypothetical protein GF350_16575 [Chitinivibrionales bacterium]|nr:hypothetical protein [Chitinivibrionales bacterium]